MEMNLNRIMQLATGSKNIVAKNISLFDYSHVISSDDFGFVINEKGDAINAHFQLRLVGENKNIANLELVYVPVSITEEYYELSHLREERTIRNLDLVIQELLLEGYRFDGQERYFI